MKINFTCPSCKRVSEAGVENAGRPVKCQCGSVIQIPPVLTSTPPPLKVAPPPLKAAPAPQPQSVSQSIKDNFDKYAEYTKTGNWEAICALNNVDFDSFGTKKEIARLPEYLEPDEVVFGLTSGIMNQSETSNLFDFGSNTWLVVLTNDRFLFLDAAMLTSSVDTQSIRHDRVQAVSASQGWVYGKIMIDLGSRLLTIDNCEKETVKVIADLANKWHRELANKSNVNAMQVPVPVEESQLDKLEKLAKLHAAGALTDDEFKVAKEKILTSL